MAFTRHMSLAACPRRKMNPQVTHISLAWYWALFDRFPAEKTWTILFLEMRRSPYHPTGIPWLLSNTSQQRENNYHPQPATGTHSRRCQHRKYHVHIDVKYLPALVRDATHYQCFFFKVGLSRSISAALSPNAHNFSHVQVQRLLRHFQSPQAFIWIFQHLNTFENPAQTMPCTFPLGCLSHFIIDTNPQQPLCNYPADSCFHYSSANIYMTECQSETAFIHQSRNIWPEDD